MRFSPKRALVLCVSFCVLALVAQTCLAQTFSSSISGTVSDPSGSMISGAKIHLRNMGTNDTRETVATDIGTYKFDNLLPGTYEITAGAPGFGTFVRSNMILRATTAASLDIRLSLGSIQERVQVTAEGILLDTESANNTATLDSRIIEALPTSYRNPLNFVFALAGTTEGQAGLTTRSGSLDQNGSMFGMNGGRTGNAQILIDGAPSTAVDWGGLFVAPNTDAVQEQQIVQNVYDAQYERSGSGVVTLVTKSGTQQYHGSVYDYFRNSALDANSWYNNHQNPIAPKGLFHRNQFGATFGGPIPGSRHLFFFASYEGLRQPANGNANEFTVPTDNERAGDFSHTLNPDGTPQVIYNPFSSHLVTDSLGRTYYTRDPFPGNRIPSSLINSVGQNIVNLFPHANRANRDNTPNDNANFFKQYSETIKNDKIDWRIDWEQNSKNRVFARMSDRLRQNDVPDCVLCNGVDNNVFQQDHGVQIVLNDTYTPTPTWVIDVNAAYSRWFEAQTRADYAKGDWNALGLSPNLSQAPMLPQINADVYGPLGAGWSNFNEYVRSNVTWLGNITKQFTRHTLKFGANYDIAFMNLRQDVPIGLNFDRGFTSCEPDTDDQGNIVGPCRASVSAADSTGNAIASMLLGTGNGQSDIRMDPAMSLHTIGAYIQDQWRVNNRLTITAGLRYENQRPATERFNRLTYFDANAVNPLNEQVGPALGRTLNGAFEFASKNNRFAWEPDNRNFAPRIGVAYRVTDKLVARVGGGLFYSPASAMIGFDLPGQFLGYSSTTSWQGSANGAGFVPSNLVSNAFPNGLVQPVGNALGPMTFVGTSSDNVQMWPKGKHKIGYTEQWSMDLQYQLTNDSVFQIGYMGTRGRHLMYGNPDLNANQLPNGFLALGRSALEQEVPNPFENYITDSGSPLFGPMVPYNQLLRPFPEFVFLNYTRSLPGASSAYDSLNVKFTKQFSKGLSVLSSYVWSKALDNGSEDLVGWAIGGLWRDAYNTKRDYGISMHDVPQSFATTFVYQLPFGRGKSFGGNAPASVNQILGNWEVSGIVRLTTGLPLFTPFYENNSLSEFGFPGYAWGNLVGNPKPAHQTTSNWINAAAFQEVNTTGDSLVLGNAPSRMTQLREGATKNVDFGVAKSFGITERFRARFGAEFLNLFNHPTYGGIFYSASSCCGSNIEEDLNSGSFGQVYGTRNDPRNIQLSLKLMF